MIDVRRMQVLRAVVTSGSVTAAAAELGYTPSAVSQQVAALEKEAGAALLERVGRGVRPTPAGRLLTEHAALIGKYVTGAEEALADLLAGRTGRLAVSYFASAGAVLMAPAVARLRREHPGVQVELELADPGHPAEARTRGRTAGVRPEQDVAAGRLDLAVVVQSRGAGTGAGGTGGTGGSGARRGAGAGGVRLEPLLDDPYRVVLPRRHRFAGRRVLDLADLADEPWVASERHGPCSQVVLDACAEAGFTPAFAAQSEDYATAQGFVAAGLGVALIPVLGLERRHPDVVVRRVRRPEPVRPICAAVREGSPGSPALAGLLEALREAAD